MGRRRAGLIFRVWTFLILVAVFGVVLNVPVVWGSGTIYIRADGSIDPPTAPIQRDGDIYTFTDNIYDRIVVEIDNIVVDGAGYTLQGPGYGNGTDLIHRSNVTIKNTEIKSFFSGIMLISSSNNTISGNNITNNECGIYLDYSSNNIISGNNITNNWIGIHLYGDRNTVYGNNIRNNEWGIYFYASSNNTISGNSITNSYMGIRLYESSTNTIYHNNFVDNTFQVYSYSSTDVWDDGYPSGGNYWSDYTVRYPSAQELDDSGLWDTPYVIDENNWDNYPLMEPWTPTPSTIMANLDIDPDTLNLKSNGKWITAYIQLPEGYNAEDIDSTTILLNGTISLVLDPKYDFVTNSSEYIVDHDGDGILERMVKFDRSMVLEYMLSKSITNGYVMLTITGEVNGIAFGGTDTIRILMSGGGTKGHK